MVMYNMLSLYFSGFDISSLCSYNPEEETGWLVGSYEKCVAFLWGVFGGRNWWISCVQEL